MPNAHESPTSPIFIHWGESIWGPTYCEVVGSNQIARAIFTNFLVIPAYRVKCQNCDAIRFLSTTPRKPSLMTNGHGPNRQNMKSNDGESTRNSTPALTPTLLDLPSPYDFREREETARSGSNGCFKVRMSGMTIQLRNHQTKRLDNLEC